MDNVINNINNILDEGSFIELSKDVNENIHIGYGTICSKLVYIISETGSILDESYVEKVIKIYDLAIKMGSPIIYIINNNGIKIDEGVKSLYLYGKILKMQQKASGVIPQIAIISGNALGGSNIIANSCDFIFIDKNKSKMWTVLPLTINDNIDDKSSEANNIKNTFMVDGIFEENELYKQIHELIDLLPSNYQDNDSYDECDDDLNRETNNINDKKIIDFIKTIADNNYYFEIKNSFAKGVFTGFIRLNGQTIGVIANRCEDKKICKKQLIKMRKFISFLDSFSIPLLTITDAIAFCVKDNEDQDISYFASKLAFTYVNSTIPKVTLIREAIGNAGLVMGSKALDVDLVYAYKDSHISIMNDKSLANLLYKEEIDKSDNKQQLLNEKIEQIAIETKAQSQIKNYIIDDIIEEKETRQLLISAFEMLFTKKEEKINRKHGAF